MLTSEELNFIFCRILKASESLGIPCQKDIHDPAVPPYTCGLFDVTIDENGCRHSTFDAFLPPEVTSRPNLFVCTESVVSRLDLKEGAEGIRVAGVFLEPSAQGLAGATSQSYISATKEVIMCAGAIATPQILMLRHAYYSIIYYKLLTPVQWTWTQEPLRGARYPGCQRLTWHRHEPCKSTLVLRGAT